MNDREKKLLVLLGGALFVVLTLFGAKTLLAKQEESEKRIAALKQRIADAEDAENKQDQVRAESEWLAKHEKPSKQGALVGSELQNFVSGQATRMRLEVRKEDILDNVEDDFLYYHRARFEVSVTGMESDLYRWLTQLHKPTAFRAVTKLRLSPNREDDTKIDAVVTVSEWFTPLPEVEGTPTETADS